MPFKRAHYFVILLIVATGFAFWSSYLGKLSSAPAAWHLHGVSAGLWMALLAIQSWSATTRRFALHGAAGKASLALFPIFFAGGWGVVWTMAKATPGDIFYEIYGARLGTLDISANFAVGWLYYVALRDRRNVQLHARAMLATPIFLISPILGRLFDHFMPGLIMAGPQDFYLFAYSTHLANLVALLLALWLYRQAPRHGSAFLFTAIIIGIQSILFETLGRRAAWRALFVGIGSLPELPWLLLWLAVGAAIAWFGWTAGRKPAPKAKTAPEPA